MKKIQKIESATLPEKAARALDDKICETFTWLENDLKQAKLSEIKRTETARQLGIFFQERCGHEQMTMEFFQNHSSNWPQGLHFGIVQKAICLARNHKEPIKTLEQARSAAQLLFQAFGDLPESRRIGPQNASAETPVMWMLTSFSGIESRFKKFEREIPTWDTATKESAKKEITRQIEFLRGLEARL